MGDGFTKLFGNILHSTVWREPAHVRLMWITMLAMADLDGVVHASIPGLADAARVTLSQCEDALKRFMSPDPYSRSKEDEGRRIEEVDGGWWLINYAKYREKRDIEHTRELAKERQRKFRARNTKEPVTGSNAATVTVTPVTQNNDILEAEEEEERREEDPATPAPAVAAPPPSLSDPLEGLRVLQKGYPRLVGYLRAAHPHAKVPEPGSRGDRDARLSLARLVRIDGYPEAEVGIVLGWVLQADHKEAEFWRDQVMSFVPLRRARDGASKFTRLHKAWSKAQQEAQPKSNEDSILSLAMKGVQQ